MWLKRKDLGIDDIFSKDILYTESWGPEYKGIDKLNTGFTNGIPGERCCAGI